MPGPFSIKLETPALAAPTAWDGYINQVYDVTVNRTVSTAGTFSVSCPLAANQAVSVERGWRVTVLQERLGVVKSDGSSFTPPPMLYRGRVNRRTIIVDETGGSTLILEGQTALGVLGDRLIHATKTYTAQTLSAILTDILTPLGVSFTVPARCTTDTLTMDFSDVSILQALIRLAEVTRTNLVDKFDGSVAFTDMNNIADASTNVNIDDPTVRVISPERVTPDSINAAAAGFAIVAGTPSFSYSADDLANRVKVVGLDYDDTQLSLEGATAPNGSNYAIQSAAAPTGNYFFLEDSASVTAYGRVERQIIRSDIRNPSNNPTTLAATKTALYAIAEGELLRRRSEVLTFQCQLANGEDIYVLPGEKVYLTYSGRAMLSDRTVTVINIARWMLVVRRAEKAAPSGYRLVTLDLATPDLTYANPALPNVTAIPTPRETQLPPGKDPKDPSSVDQKNPCGYDVTTPYGAVFHVATYEQALVLAGGPSKPTGPSGGSSSGGGSSGGAGSSAIASSGESFGITTNHEGAGIRAGSGPGGSGNSSSSSPAVSSSGQSGIRSSSGPGGAGSNSGSMSSVGASGGRGNAIANLGQGGGNAIANTGQGGGNAVANLGQGGGNAVANLGQGGGNAVANTGQSTGNVSNSAEQRWNIMQSSDGPLDD